MVDSDNSSSQLCTTFGLSQEVFSQLLTLPVAASFEEDEEDLTRAMTPMSLYDDNSEEYRLAIAQRQCETVIEFLKNDEAAVVLPRSEILYQDSEDIRLGRMDQHIEWLCEKRETVRCKILRHNFERTYGCLRRKGEGIIMTTGSGFKNWAEQGPSILDNPVWTNAVLEVAKIIHHDFPVDKMMDHGIPGQAGASHAENKLVLWFVAQAITNCVTGELDSGKLEEFRHRRNIGCPYRTVITVDQGPCQSCWGFLNAIQDRTGIGFEVEFCETVGPIQRIRVGGVPVMSLVPRNLTMDERIAKQKSAAHDIREFARHSLALKNLARYKPRTGLRTPRRSCSARSRNSSRSRISRQHTPNDSDDEEDNSFIIVEEIPNKFSRMVIEIPAPMNPRQTSPNIENYRESAPEPEDRVHDLYHQASALDFKSLVLQWAYNPDKPRQ